MTESAGAGWKESLALIAEATGRETTAAEALADAEWLVYAVYPDENVEAAVAERQAGPLWTSLGAVQAGQAGQAFAVDDGSWMSGVGLFGADSILDDLEMIFDVATG
ncbi:MAG: hypothetical protein ACRBI6_22415 [Acidimicrobiales bacterium]